MIAIIHHQEQQTGDVRIPLICHRSVVDCVTALTNHPQGKDKTEVHLIEIVICLQLILRGESPQCRLMTGHQNQEDEDTILVTHFLIKCIIIVLIYPNSIHILSNGIHLFQMGIMYGEPEMTLLIFPHTVQEQIEAQSHQMLEKGLTVALTSRLQESESILTQINHLQETVPTMIQINHLRENNQDLKGELLKDQC